MPFFFGILVFLPFEAAGQGGSPRESPAGIPALRCGETGLLVWGHVTEGDGIPVVGAQVWPVGMSCGTLTDSLGAYAFAGLEPGQLISFQKLTYDAWEQRVPASGDTVRMDVTLHFSNRVPVVTRDFHRFPDRPAAMTDPEGIAGCYWMGSYPAQLGSLPEGIELQDGGAGRFLASDAGRLRWHWEPVPRRIWIDLLAGSVLAHATGFIEVGDTPDWSNLPTRIRYDSDDLSLHPHETETFAVRIPCPVPDRIFLTRDFAHGAMVNVIR